MKLIGLITVAVGVIVSVAASAQPAVKISRIGVLWQVPPPPPIHPNMVALLHGLQNLG